MAEFKLGRIRFVWKGDWSSSTQYYVDDVIRYGGRTYICAVGHTSASNFNTDLTYSPTKWNQMSDGQEWKGDWSTSTFYKINDIVKYGGLLYIANTAHTSSSSTGSGAAGLENATGLEANQSDWTLYAEGLDWKTDWAINTRYKVNDIVKYGGYSYVANVGHTSAATAADGLESQQSYWDTLNAGLEYKGAWAGLTRYKVNDVVKRGSGLWIVKAGQEHTSTTNWETDEAAGYWDQFVEGFEYEDTWNVSTPYQQGDIVKYGGNHYISKTSHTGTTPTANSQTDWDLYGEDFDFQSDWANTTSYKIGQVVNHGGYTYRASADSPTTTITVTATDAVTNQLTTTDTSAMVADMSIRFSGTSFGDVNIGATYYIKTIDSATTFTIATSAGGAVFTPTTATGTLTARFAAQPPHASYWDQLNGGISWQGVWSDDREYIKGDAVKFGSNAYICIKAHRSEADDGSTIGEQGGGTENSRPDQDITGTYWNVMTIGSDTDILTTTGDLVYYSGAGPSRLPVGQEGQVLVSDGTYPEWATLGKVDQIYYVAPEGTDLPAPIHGVTLGKPFKTIRYACEQVENGPRNPDAQYLLERNRIFLQREVSSYLEYQVANATPGSIWENFDYDEYKCERDVGYIIDRLIWDIGHGGNLKVRAAALSFVNGFSADGEFSDPSEDKVYGGAGLAAEAEQSVAAYTYLQTIIGNVLANTAPTTAYQDSSDSTAVAAQYIDTNYTTEAGVITTITALMKIVTDTITAGDTSKIPARDVPNVLINVKSGKYEETLPIIVPAETCILGDEIRSTTVVARGSSVDISDSYYTVDSFNHLRGFIDNIVAGTAVTPTSGNTTTQDQTWPVADDSETGELTAKLVDVMRVQADYRLGTKHVSYTNDPTGYNSSYLVGYGDARKLLKENKKFLQEEIVQFMIDNYPKLKYSKTDTREDVGHIVDAIVYDLTYGGNAQSIIAARSYWDGEGTISLIPDSIKVETLASHVKLRSLINDVVLANSITALQTTIPQFTDTAGSSAAATFAVEHLDIITNSVRGDSTGADLPSVTIASINSNVITTTASHSLQVGDAFIPLEASNNLVKDSKYFVISTPAANTLTVSETYGGSVFTLTNGSGLSVPVHVEDNPAATDGVSSTTALITAAETLDAQQEALVTLVNTYIDTTYPTLTYNEEKCKRDTRLILEAVMWDFQLNTNFNTLIAAQAYLRSSSSEVFSLNQKPATRASFKYLADTIAGDTATYLNSDSTAASRVADLMDLLDSVFFAASNEGEVCATNLRVRDWARLKLEENRPFIQAELAAYIDETYSDTVTATTASSNVITISDTSWLRRNVSIKFTGTPYGGLDTTTTYYVQNVVSDTTFTVATTRYAANAVALTSVSSGTFGVELLYNDTLCARDVDTYIDALKWDLQWTSNYKSRYVARYYGNAVLGSAEEDMYYLRNGTGIRNQTMRGLIGDMLPENEYGTSRVSAGAYCSLDPGWGPDDFRTWIIARSPYVQGNTTFGNAAIGQKIDGALHNGGNDSIVSNDFTQVISDGIGAWVANNGRAELVSVFTYYAHIGYLSTEGGRIRGTNGNNSYGDFGSVAEGFDSTETPGTAIVDNRLQFEATAGITNTDNAQEIYNIEFDNAGSEYQEATWSFFGAGSGATAEADEFRDGAVFNVRLLDNVDDSTNAPEADGNFGGFGYITNSNTAQGGTTTQITIAAVDSETSTAYPGMKIYVTGGAGVGQFGIIDTYNSGTKIATVTKESDGTAGWDHLVPGTTIVAPDASSTYKIEPRVTLTAPTFSATSRTLSASGNYDYITYVPIFASYENTAQSSTTGSGSSARFDITKKGTKYLVRLAEGGSGYARLDTITILGSAIGGVDSTNDITITVTSVNSTNGAIQAFDKEGNGAGGNFIVLPASASNQDVLTSSDGSTFSTRSSVLPVSRTWTGIAAGKLTITETAGNFVTGRSYTITKSGDTPWASIGSSSIVAGTTFVATGAGTFTNTAGEATPNAAHVVAVAGSGTDDTAISLDGGVTWTAGGNLPSNANWVDVAYGSGRFMAIVTGGNATAVTADGGTTWTAGGNLPSSTTWESVAYGGGYWVAVASGGSTVAYSSDNGVTWAAGSGLSSSDWKSVTWGNNRFVAVSNTSGTKAAISIDGESWTETTLPASKTWVNVSYGQGVFLAVNSSDNIAATSPDGITWTSRTLSTNLSSTGARASAHGNPDQEGKFVVIQEGTGTAASEIRAGATARARAYVATNKIFAIRITEPGSGYTSAPTITITDPNNTFEAPTQIRIGNGALANPSFTNRGTGFSSASADLDTGDGFANIFQSGQFVAVRRLTERPAVGSNVVFGHRPGDVFKLVQVLTLLGSYDGSYTAFLQVAPDVTAFDSPPDGTSVTTRIRYSQVRLTGHDFLDIGTGSFTETNYPNTPTQDPQQGNETKDDNGGRVFFTSTDQDGNFRVGDLFTIEQSTGVATLNADAFNISGLQELTLGEVTLGGNSASVQEFSTDPFFTANSDNVVPTQRAIKAYISSQIGGGGASLNVNSVTAGSILISTNQITTTTGVKINMNATFEFKGGVSGLPIAFNYFLT